MTDLLDRPTTILHETPTAVMPEVRAAHRRHGPGRPRFTPAQQIVLVALACACSAATGVWLAATFYEVPQPPLRFRERAVTTTSAPPADPGLRPSWAEVGHAPSRVDTLGGVPAGGPAPAITPTGA